MAKIKLQYQVRHTSYGIYNHCKVSYEVRELEHVIDDTKDFRSNLDEAFSKACDLGADPNKQIKWNTIY